LLEDPRVMDWLQGQDAAFVLMSDKDFEDVVVSLDLQDIPSLRSQLDDERLRLEQELDKTDVKKTLFPTHVQGLQVREERIREAMRPYRQAGRLRVLLGREYFIRRSVLENYHRHLLELRPNEANDLSTRRRALREEASLVGATS
jgi:predicted ATP-dependent endonuclease of OLD family